MHKVLYLCGSNSCSSQIAEAWTSKLHPNNIEVHSAGLVAYGLNPNAVRTMKELSIDLTKQKSKTIEAISHIDFDLAVTIWEKDNCQLLNTINAERFFHIAMEEPAEVARRALNELELLECYRRCRDTLHNFVRDELLWVLN
jgi:arsenate reductase (thioredoxin)